MRKKANLQLLTRTILIVVALFFGGFLLNAGERFVNHGGVFARYHLMETGYILQTMLASPSVVSLGYNFDLHTFKFVKQDENFVVYFGNFESGTYKFTFDKNVEILFGELSQNNTFFRSSKLIFSDEKFNHNKYLCPIITTSMDSPIILIAILNNNDTYRDRLINYYTNIRGFVETGLINFEDLTHMEDKQITVPNNLSILFSDIESDLDIIIYYKPKKEINRLACLIYNEIQSINFEDINMVLVPSNNIYSDIQININFESRNLRRGEANIPRKISEAIGVFFN